MEKAFNYFYKITNNVNGNYYYGIHSTNNLDDGYMGSGHRLLEAYKLFGTENFSKEILKYFNTRKELSEYEASFVTEHLVDDKDCYNAMRGGEAFNTLGYIACTDIVDGIVRLVKTQEYHANPQRYKAPTSGTVLVKKKGEENWQHIPKDEYDANKDGYITPMSGFSMVKDRNGNIFRVTNDDPKLKDGTYKYLSQGKKHTEETKEKIRKAHIEGGLQSGEKNSNYGKKWMHKVVNGSIISKAFPRDNVEQQEKEGWLPGRVITKKVVRKDAKINKINTEELIREYKNGADLESLSKKYKICKSYAYKIGRGERKKSI